MQPKVKVSISRPSSAKLYTLTGKSCTERLCLPWSAIEFSCISGILDTSMPDANKLSEAERL